MRDLNWEGLILRRDVPYEGKRTNNMLKFKDMMDQEYEVLDIEVGPFRIVEDNKEVTVEILSAVKIKHKGYDVSVGSGFTIEQRKMFYEDPSKIVGHKITVQYFEESKDKSGNLSLRFPVFKAIRDMKD
jgi:DNA ligase-1